VYAVFSATKLEPIEYIEIVCVPKVDKFAPLKTNWAEFANAELVAVRELCVVPLKHSTLVAFVRW